MVTAVNVLLAIVCLGLIIVVLLQSGKSAGLSGAIGGASEHLIGKTKARGIDALLGKVTVVLAILFLILTLLAGYSDVWAK
ncbi:preprotein translocase subunit SecG [Marininema halotolerans]|uniref:Protein-export membrane protein SecG n=1 Tax=Marininema halotolerans TaxID=1155944 RepID=A0A1I6NW69_9BACL|nr:preprotein translocase subunit SecG [Marininema halotolerans]SFS32088.1 preprotein translocase subunit SecG [Marininema halotolerans]